MNRVQSAHSQEYSKAPDVAVSAPGTVPLFGEHSESAGGNVMICAVQQRMSVAVSRRSDNSLRFFSATLGERKKTSVATLKWRREDRWANNCKGVIASLQSRNYTVPGLEFTIDGNVPAKVGLGSSSAICIATVVALNKLLKLGLSTADMIAVAVEAESAFQSSVVSSAAVAASLLSKPGHIMVWNPQSGQYSYYPFFSSVSRLIWIDPQVPTTREEIRMIQQRLSEAQGCVDLLVNNSTQDSLLRLSDADLAHGIGTMPEDVRRGCLHLRDDESRLTDAVAALEHHDPHRFGKLLYRSHDSLRDLYEISNPEIDWLVRRRDTVPGVYGGRRVGFGASASLVVLIEHSALDDYIDKLPEYERIFGFTPRWNIIDLSGGTMECSA